jgi:hypothetical protein
MTPLEFANQYLEMDTFIYPLEVDGADAQQATTDAGDWQHLRVARYRSGTSSWDKTLWQDISPRLPQLVSVKVKNIWGDTEDVTLTHEQLWRHFHCPFVGKGSPEQAQVTIQLVYRYHVVLIEGQNMREETLRSVSLMNAKHLVLGGDMAVLS